jgi:hypothetical protein
LILLTALLLAGGTHDMFRLGPNLLTAELLVAIAAAARLVKVKRAASAHGKLQHSGR